MNIAYVHTGKWPSNSPSITFTTYNALGGAEVFDQFFFFIKKNYTGSELEVFKNTFGQSKPHNLHLYALKNILNSNKIYFHRVSRILKSKIKQNSIHGLITRNPGFLPFLVKFKQNFSIPVFYETHDFFTDDKDRDEKFSKHQKYYQIMEKSCIPYLSGVICLQNPQMNLYRNYYPDQNFILARTGIHKICNADFKSRKYLTYIGSLDQHKGVMTVLEAIRICPQTDLKVLIVGGKNQQEIKKWKRILDNYGLSSRVIITGWVDKNKLSGYLNQTLLGVIPLQDSFFNRYLTSPLKLFDYLSHGIPIISSDLNSIRDLIQEDYTGVFFKPDDPENLAITIDRLYSDKEHLKEMMQNVYSTASDLSWKKRSEILKNYFDEFK